MAQLVEFPLAAGGLVLVEVMAHAAGPVTRRPEERRNHRTGAQTPTARLALPAMHRLLWTVNALSAGLAIIGLLAVSCGDASSFRQREAHDRSEP
jgi:hypothetical protein